MNLLTVIMPLLAALLAGGGVALFTARSTKSVLDATASKTAVETVQASIDNLRVDLAAARDRITALEQERTDCNKRIEELEKRLRAEVERLGTSGRG